MEGQGRSLGWFKNGLGWTPNEKGINGWKGKKKEDRSSGGAKRGRGREGSKQNAVVRKSGHQFDHQEGRRATEFVVGRPSGEQKKPQEGRYGLVKSLDKTNSNKKQPKD